MDKATILRLIESQQITPLEGVELLEKLNQRREERIQVEPLQAAQSSTQSAPGKLKLRPATPQQAKERIDKVAPQLDPANLDPAHEVKDTDVAVIGMAGRFPGATTLDAYWQNLKAGICTIMEIPPERWD